jgi:hypothetical protein
MNFEKLNTWLTFVANVGVIIGLIFLVVELRLSNHQSASATEQDRANTVDQKFREFALSNHMPEIYVKISESGVNSLTPVELLRAQNWERARQTHINGQIKQFQQGYLAESAYQTILGIASEMRPLWIELGLESSENFKYIYPTVQESTD